MSENKTMSSGKLPRISVVTPSYNQGCFLQETIDSVQNQHYPDVEHIIIDGGSTDNTMDVIRRNGGRIAYWVSEPDNGQCHAINKGFARASGDIHYWLCSDDLLEPGALMHVAERLPVSPEPAWLVGAARLFHGKKRTMRYRRPEVINRDTFLRWASNWIPTQSTFWNRAMWDAAGPFDEDIHYVMDLALWERMFCVNAPIVSDKVLGAYRFHSAAKSISLMSASKKERREYTERLVRKHWGALSGDPAGKEFDELLSRYADALEEAGDYRAALEEVNNHKLFGPLLKLWRRMVYERFAQV
ncbi:MAG TPA: glycosyltransferase [Gammaproteobacteria bacterium]|nr:glycosyltransferase [Gammaproteobacteria bacterium]